MRKLKLQMQMSVDGFVGGPNGELDFMTWDWDESLKKYVGNLTESFDTILLGRKMTDGFISHWTNIVNNHPDSPEYPSAKIFVDTPKVVFSKTLNKSNWTNTRLTKGDIVDEINRLKKEEGKDIIVYGGANFASSLVENNLIDEYYLFVNPAVIGKGLSIFHQTNGKKSLKLVESKFFDCGIVLHHYQPVQ